MATQVTQENRHAVVTFLRSTLQDILVGQSVPDDQVNQLEAKIFAQHGKNQEQYLTKVEQKVAGIRRKMQQQLPPQQQLQPIQQPQHQPQPLQQWHPQQQQQPLHNVSATPGLLQTPVQVPQQAVRPVPTQQTPQQQMPQIYGSQQTPYQTQQRPPPMQQQQQQMQQQQQQAMQARQQQQQQARDQQARQQQQVRQQQALQVQQQQQQQQHNQRMGSAPHMQRVPSSQHILLRSQPAQQNPQLHQQQQQVIPQLPQQHLQPPSHLPQQQQHQLQLPQKPGNQQQQQQLTPHQSPHQRQLSAQQLPQQQPVSRQSQNHQQPFTQLPKQQQQEPILSAEDTDFSDMAQAFILSHPAPTSEASSLVVARSPSLHAALAPPYASQPMPATQGYASTPEAASATAQQFWHLQVSMRATYLEDLTYVAILLHQFKLRQTTTASSPQMAMLQQLVEGTPMLRVPRGNPKYEAAIRDGGPRGLLARLTALQTLLTTVMPRLSPTLDSIKAAHKRKQAAASGQPPQPACAQQNASTMQQIGSIGAQGATSPQPGQPMFAQPVSNRDRDMMAASSTGGGALLLSRSPSLQRSLHSGSMPPLTAPVSGSQALIAAIGRCEQPQLAAAAAEVRYSMSHSDAAALNPPPPPHAWLAAMRSAQGTGSSGASSGYAEGNGFAHSSGNSCYVGGGASSYGGSAVSSCGGGNYAYGYGSGGSSSGSPILLVSRTVNDCYGSDDVQAMTWRGPPTSSNSATSASNSILGAKRKVSGHSEAMRNVRAAVVAECQEVQAGSPDDMRLQISSDGDEGWMVRCTPRSSHQGSGSLATSPPDTHDTPAKKAPGPTLEQRSSLEQRPLSTGAEAQSMVVRVGVEYPRTPPQAEFPAAVSLRENKAVEELQTCLAAGGNEGWTVSGLARQWGAVVRRRAGNGTRQAGDSGVEAGVAVANPRASNLQQP